MSVYFLMAQPGTLVLKRAAFAAITMFCTVFLWKQLTMPGLSPNPTTKLPNYGVSLKSVSLVYCETGMRQNTSCFNLFVSKSQKFSLDSNIKSMKLINPPRVFNNYLFL